MSVFGVDVGYKGQFKFDQVVQFFDDKIPNDWLEKNILVEEEMDVRNFKLNMEHKMGLLSLDVSFLSQCEIIPSLAQYNPHVFLTLVKPQYEFSGKVN